MRLSEKRRAKARSYVEGLIEDIRGGYYGDDNYPTVTDPLVALVHEQKCLAHNKKAYEELYAEWREALLFHDYGPDGDFWSEWSHTFSSSADSIYVSDVVVLWALRLKEEFDDGRL